MKRWLISFLLLCVPCAAFAANGDITAARIKGTDPGDGWVLQIDVASSGGSSINVGGTYAFGLDSFNRTGSAKVVLTVTSLGYDSGGNPTTITRTIYGTQWLRKPYPDQTAANESLAEGTLTLEVALSDFVYVKDKAGAGNSGTDITATIAAGLYTQGGTGTASWSGTVTNNSDLTYPTSIGRWAWPAYELVTGSSYMLEAIAFNRFARNAQPLAAMKFTCTDANSHSDTQIATSMTKTTRSGDANPVLVYAKTMDFSGMTDGDVITCDFTAYPWVGDSALTSNSGVTDPDERLTSFKVQYSTNYGTAFAVVDATNGQASAAATWVGNTQSGVETAYSLDNTASYTTIGYAVQAIKAYNNATYSRNNPGGGVILLSSGNHAYPGTSPGATQGTQTTWLTIKPISTVARANAIINTGTNNSLKTQKVKLEGVTVTSNSLGQFVGVATTDVLWLHNNALTISGSAPVYNWMLCSGTNNLVTAFNGNMSHYSTNRSPWGLVRGNTISSITNSIDQYCVIGNSGNFQLLFNATGNTWNHQTSENSIVAFNTCYNLDNKVWDQPDEMDLLNGIAVVQNVVERVDTTQPLNQTFADNSGYTSNNIILWHNTFAGARINIGYNDTGSVSYSRLNYSQVGNMFHDWNNKDDTFPSENGTRVGSWSVGYNVGSRGEYYRACTFRGEFDGISYYLGGTLGYAGDRSYSGTKMGNGDYRLTANSSALNLIPSGQAVLPYDLDGNVRNNLGKGSAGAYEYYYGQLIGSMTGSMQ